MPISNQLPSWYDNNLKQTTSFKVDNKQPSTSSNLNVNSNQSSLLTSAQSDTVHLSNEAKSEQEHEQSGSSMFTMNTANGYKNINLDDYFLPPQVGDKTYSLDDLPPLLMPSQDNVDALTKHLSQKMPQFLAENNIPEAPSTITYDTEGQIQLPADYPYAKEFKQALEETPAMARELQAVNALASHVNEMKKLTPFNEEFSQAESLAEQNLIVKKYQHLLNDNRENDTMILNFDSEGKLSITSDAV